MAERLSPFREAMKEYSGNVSSIAVRNISPSNLEGLFVGIVEKENIFFLTGEEVEFKYYSPSYEAQEFASSHDCFKYPIEKGVAHIDASTIKRRKIEF